MLTRLYQSAAILGVVIVFCATDAVFIARYDRERKKTGKSWGYTLSMLIAAGFMIAQPVTVPGIGIQTGARWGLVIQAVGVLLAVGGLGLHGWSRAHLKQLYAEDAIVEMGHQVVDTGPYAYVRHPMFASYFLLAAGLALINPAVPTALLAVYISWDFAQAARRDEDLLCREVPGYTDYVARTPRRFVPRWKDIVKHR
jgi:protein-S-isoprenylcysteine O-methyltransferase Ste14